MSNISYFVNPMTELEQLPRTDSDYVRKKDAMGWLYRRTAPTDREIIDTIVPKRYGQTGSTFSEDISDIRIKGNAEFVETVAGLLPAFLSCESGNTRLEISLQKVTDRETGAKTDAWSLYLKAVERGNGRQPRTLDAIPDDLYAGRK